MRSRPEARSTVLALLAVAVAGTALALLIQIGDAAYGQTAHELNQEADARLADTASETGAQLDHLLLTRLADVEALADSPAAQRLDAASILRGMGAADRVDGGGFSALIVVDRRGRPLVEFRPGAGAGAPAASSRGRLLGGIRLRHVLTAPGIAEVGTGSPLAAGTPAVAHDVVLSAPIRHVDGRVAGAWLGVVPRDEIGGVVTTTLATLRAQDERVYVVDRGRTIVVSEPGGGAAPPGDARALGAGSGRVPQALPDTPSRAGAGGTELVAAAPPFAHTVLSRLGWSVAASEYRSAALAPARRVNRDGWLIVLTAALVVLAAGAIVARSLRRSSAQRERLDRSLRQSQKLEAVGRLAGSIAHDFNNVLTVIAGNAQLALGTRPEGDVETNLREIVYSSERASDLVRRLLAFSRPGEQRATAVDLNDAVAGLVRVLPRLIEANIDVSTELAPAPAFVLLDATRLEQVLLNLALNARDAMPNGGRLVFGTQVDRSVVRLRVSDDGPGMNPHTRERIFDPFFTTKPEGKGTGLGLATVYGIVTQAGGSIAVDSAPGQGATFTIELPPAPAGAVAPSAHGRLDTITGSGERVLVLDDDETVRVVAAAMLTRAGYVVTSAGDGAAALELLDRGERFDLVVSDIMMPRMTGLELADVLHARGDETPIVFMSGYSADAPGASDPGPLRPTITKPFSQGEIADAAGRLLAGAGAAHAN